jgi:hypothetical protein
MPRTSPRSQNRAPRQIEGSNTLANITVDPFRNIAGVVVSRVPGEHWLGEIINVLRHGGACYKWNVAARQVEVADEMYRQAVTEAKQNISRVQRMLGIGTTVLQSSFLRAPLMKSCWKSLDARKTPLRFHSAQAAGKRNWGVPLWSLWLDDPQSSKCVQR